MWKGDFRLHRLRLANRGECWSCRSWWRTKCYRICGLGRRYPNSGKLVQANAPDEGALNDQSKPHCLIIFVARKRECR